MNIYISGIEKGIKNAFLEEVLKTVNDVDHILIIPQSNDIKERVAFIAKADVVITMPGWGSQTISGKEVQIARLLDIQVAFYTALKDLIPCTP